jgi:hypothetical protein
MIIPQRMPHRPDKIDSIANTIMPIGNAIVMPFYWAQSRLLHHQFHMEFGKSFKSKSTLWQHYQWKTPIETAVLQC